jgi:hypothetical protein
MACQILLDMEPFIVKAALSNMLSPEGWQERITMTGTRRKGLLDLKSQGYLDEVLRYSLEDDALNGAAKNLCGGEVGPYARPATRRVSRVTKRFGGPTPVYAQTIFRTSELSVSGSEVDDGLVPFPSRNG